MIEIYLLEGLEETSIGPLLKKITDYELAYLIRKAPRKHKKVLSAYVPSAYKQAGIYGLPLDQGTIRLLLSAEKVRPITGESIHWKDGAIETVASHPDPETLCAVALHELGHALQATTRRGRNCVLSVKAKREFMGMSKKVLHDSFALERLSEIYPDGVVELDGLHCLNRGCLAQAYTPDMVAIFNSSQPFCDACTEGFKKGVKKLNDVFAAEHHTCGDCVHLRKCMDEDPYVYDESRICKDFEEVIPAS